MAKKASLPTTGKTWKLFIAALAFALMAGVAAMIYLRVLEHRLEARLQPPPREMVKVVVAARDLPAGSKVNASNMAIRNVPKEYVNSDVITPGSFSSVTGAVLIKPLQSGKMLTQDYIDLNIPKDFSGTIQPGHRAMTIQVDEVNSISGMIRPGNYIDLYTRIAARAIGENDTASGEVVIPVLEKVLVLATDQRTARPNEDEFRHLKSRNRNQTYNTLTLEVTPEQAALISLAETRGNLVATLRNERETGGVLFSKISLRDLYLHSAQLFRQALSRHDNRKLDGVTVNKHGQLVTRDGTVVTDPNVRMTKNGLLVTKDGVVLSGRGLVVGKDGRIRTQNGRLVDTASLVAGKHGTLVDKHGTVLSTNGYRTLKGGFLMDKDGNILTPDGKVLKGVHLAKDGTVRTADGQVLQASQLAIDKDGHVYLKQPGAAKTYSVDGQGVVRDADGRVVKARDLVTVDKDGTVRTRDGRVLKGVHVGKDGALYTADGRKLSAADILKQEAVASASTEEQKKLHSSPSDTYSVDGQGVVRDADGRVVKARDLVTVGKDGTVRTRDGRVLKGVHVGKDGALYTADGRKLSAADILKQEAVASVPPKERKPLQGVTASSVAGLAARIVDGGATVLTPQPVSYQVEYIIGGSTRGVATTFKVQIDDKESQEITADGQ